MRTLFLPALIFVSFNLITSFSLEKRQSSKQIWITAKSKHVNASFAMFLPPKPGQIVGDHEQDAIAFGTKASGQVKKFPTNFITRATYLSTSKYIQVTGCINRSKYGLRRDDGGGQFDSNGYNGDWKHLGAPAGSKCIGYSSYVQILEPDGQRFCVRCCKSGFDSSCPTAFDIDGCMNLMPNGNYNGCS